MPASRLSSPPLRPCAPDAPAKGDPAEVVASRPPRRDLSPFEQRLVRRIHVLSFAPTGIASLAYFALIEFQSGTLGWRPWPLSVAVLIWPVIGLSAWTAWRTQDRVLAISVLTWPLFVMLSVLMAVQGGAGGTAVWWLTLLPALTLHAGSARMGVSMLLLLAGQLIALRVLQAVGIDLTLLPPATDTQRVIAAAGTALCLAAVVASDLHWRRRMLAELETAQRIADDALDVKARFLSNVSHELRTPLNGVVGAAELLASSQLDAGQQQAVSILTRSNAALTTLIEDLFDFSRLKTGYVRVEDMPMQVSELLFDTAEMFAAQAQRNGIELVVHCESDVPDVVLGDPARVAQILQNLSSNAVKFTPSGEVRLTASRVRDDSEGTDWLQLSVADTGIGVTAQQREQLFKAFQQGDGSITRRYGGSGLGLAISRELAQLMGGRIEVASVPNVGSTFTLRLPLLTPHREPPAIEAVAAMEPIEAAPPSPPAAESLLLAVGNPRLLASVEGPMRAHGLRIAATASLPDANALLAAQNSGVDLVVADEGLLAAAGVSHTEWADRLRGARLAGVVLVTASGDAQNLPTGVWPVFKPARPHRLKNAVTQAREWAAAQWAAETPSAVDRGVPMQWLSTRGASTVRPSQPANATRVLLVEDHPVNQLVARTMLEQLGCTVMVAGDGHEALARFSDAAVAFDVVLMDCHMPVMDGFAASRALRDMEAQHGLARTPIIAMTANSEAEGGQACREAGMDDYLSKPVALGRLQEVIAAWTVPRRDTHGGRQDAQD
ncbi:MAG: signal transduction histidine kinase [Rhizobacter sp.]|nr:signal transduction histidine kinase [Rhizobacter sp.]